MIYTIKEAILFHHLKDLKREMKRLEKLDDISKGDFRKTQSFMKEFSLEFCRMGFRLRTKQFICRVYMPKLFGGVLWCHSCSTGPEDGPGGGQAPQESQAYPSPGGQGRGAVFQGQVHVFHGAERGEGEEEVEL